MNTELKPGDWVRYEGPPSKLSAYRLNVISVHGDLTLLDSPDEVGCWSVKTKYLWKVPLTSFDKIAQIKQLMMWF